MSYKHDEDNGDRHVSSTRHDRDRHKNSRESKHVSSRTKEQGRDFRDYKDINERESRDSYGRSTENNNRRHRDYDQDRDRRSRRRSRSRSNEKIRKRCRSRSPSPSKSSRRASGFDMAPSVPGLQPNGAVPVVCVFFMVWVGRQCWATCPTATHGSGTTVDFSSTRNHCED